MSRLNRIDAIGATEKIRRSARAEDLKSQRWILDRFYRLMGRGALFWNQPEETLAHSIEIGNEISDLMETSQRIKCIEMYCKENLRTALRLERSALREEQGAHFETAQNYYYRSCLFYIAASWPIFDSDDREYLWIRDKINGCYDKVISYSEYRIERVEIPFGGKKLAALLFLASDKEELPAVIFVPGMDMSKEQAVNALDNPYVRRKLNCLALDGPGVGESLVRKIWVDCDNWASAVSKAIDYLERRPEIDKNRIGLHGQSMGSYWAPLAASRDKRVRAIATQNSCYYSKDHIFNETSPNFRARFMWMAGLEHDEELDRLASKMTLEGSEKNIDCPHLIFHGQFDHLCSTLETFNYFDRLASEIKELRIYENEYHGVGKFFPELTRMSADWLRDRLMGVNSKEKRKVVLIDWGTREECPVNEAAIKSGFANIRKD